MSIVPSHTRAVFRDVLKGLYLMILATVESLQHLTVNQMSSKREVNVPVTTFKKFREYKKCIKMAQST